MIFLSFFLFFISLIKFYHAARCTGISAILLGCQYEYEAKASKRQQV